MSKIDVHEIINRRAEASPPLSVEFSLYLYIYIYYIYLRIYIYIHIIIYIFQAVRRAVLLTSNVQMYVYVRPAG